MYSTHLSINVLIANTIAILALRKKEMTPNFYEMKKTDSKHITVKKSQVLKKARKGKAKMLEQLFYLYLHTYINSHLFPLG